MLSIQELVIAVEEQPTGVILAAVVGAFLLLRVAAGSVRPEAYRYAKPAAYLPVLKSTLDLMFFHKHRIYDWVTDQCVALEGRPWPRAVAGAEPTIMLSTPEQFEDVLKTQFESFQRGDAAKMSDLFQKGIFTSDGEIWAFHRKTASNLFSNQMIKDVMYEAVLEKCARLCDALRVYESRGQPVSFKAVIMHFTSDVFGKIGFGVDLNCLENGVEGKKGNEFIEAFATATKIHFFRLIQPQWLWGTKRFFNIGSERENTECREVIDKFIYRVINESIARKSAASSSDKTSASAPPKDLISLFLNTKIKAEENLKGRAFDSEMHLIRDTIVSFIFAGKDTTSHTMSFFVVMMNRYPDVLAKIREEIRTRLPRSPTGEILIPSMDDLAQLTYLEGAIRENLRLNPAAPTAARQATEDVVLCDGTRLAKGTRVGLAIYASGRMKSIWGDDALEFKPERWIDPATGKNIAVSPFKFAPFIGGRRNCIGAKFAMMQIKCTLAVLMSQFDFATVEDPWKITYEAAMTMAVKGSLMVNVMSLSHEIAQSASQ